MASAAESVKNLPIRVWAQDEGRFGLMGDCRSCWAPAGMRPVTRQAMTREYLYGFAAVCPQADLCCAMTMPYANGDTMSLFLKTLSEESTGFLNVMILDGAGWHTAHALKVPDNIVLVKLPPYSPELNPVELLWDWIRDHHFMNDALKNLDEVESRLLGAFHAIIKTPGLIQSMAMFPWIERVISSLS